MSRPYADVGRTGQKRRTLDALVAAARHIVASGASQPWTKLRSRRVWPGALHTGTLPAKGSCWRPPVLDRTDVDAADNPPEGVAERVDAVVVEFTTMIIETEAQQRTMLRLSLEPAEGRNLPLRQGRAIGWIDGGACPSSGKAHRTGNSSARPRHPQRHRHRIAGVADRHWRPEQGRCGCVDAVVGQRATQKQALSQGPPEVAR